MKITDKVKIGGYEYTCKIIPNLSRDFGTNARSCANSLDIEIEETLPQQNKKSVLIHEILEHIFVKFNLYIELTINM